MPRRACYLILYQTIKNYAANVGTSGEFAAVMIASFVWENDDRFAATAAVIWIIIGTGFAVGLSKT
jgi:hypothetical protein